MKILSRVGGRSRRALWLAGSGLCLILIFANAVVGKDGFLAHRRQQRRIQELQQQIAIVQRDNTRLSEEIRDLQSNPSTIEKLAREELRLGRPGEAIVTLGPSQPPSSPAPEPPH